MPTFVPPFDPAAVRRVLIVKLSALGDVVCALPVSAALAEAYPHWQLSWVVEEPAAPVVRANPCIHDVIVLPRHWSGRPWRPSTWARLTALFRELRSRQFDLVLDLQGLTKSAVLARATGATLRFGYDWLRELAPLVLTRVPRRPESVHIVDQLLDVARFLGAPAAKVAFPLNVTADDEQAAEELLRGAGLAGRRFVAVNPTDGGGGQKGWPPDRLAAVCDALAVGEGLACVLIGGPGDRQAGDAVLARARRRPADLIGRTTLGQLAAVLARATLHLSGDTGTAHLAAALGRPAVTIFGRSNPARLAPYGQQHRVVQRRDECAPACRHWHAVAPLNSAQKCLAGRPQCLAAVTVADVLAAVRACLREQTPLPLAS